MSAENQWFLNDRKCVELETAFMDGYMLDQVDHKRKKLIQCIHFRLVRNFFFQHIYLLILEGHVSSTSAAG